ncbi:hypothetical protein [Streptomyces hydrogenans]|uniref:hypothetical protein n=1 Tax=Streptomyces hydrogenans TaxID=1873719 RepID=UPI0035DDA27A
MSGADWLYRVKVWPDCPVNSDADITTRYFTDHTEAVDYYTAYRSAGRWAEFASAAVGDFFRHDPRTAV